MVHAQLSQLAPLVSVVIPTFNRAASLDRTLGAIKRCAAPAGGVEVIVVDDGSSDGTADVCKGHGVDYVYQANHGPASARNRGWRRARGGIVAFTDDDTVPDANWLVDLCAEFEVYPGAAAVGGLVRPLVPGFVADFVQSERLVGHSVVDGQVHYLVTANAAYRREALTRLGGFDESFPTPAGEDTDLTLRALEAGLSLRVSTRAAVQHEHPTSLRGLARTYRRHGEARNRIVSRHPGATSGATARAMAAPGYWLGRYDLYRTDGAGRLRAAAYCLMRACGLCCYSWGIVRSRLQRSNGPTRG